MQNRNVIEKNLQLMISWFLFPSMDGPACATLTFGLEGVIS